ncbi:MAG: hypothetical protein ACLUD2_10465 [Clostridium sp.]
MQQKVSQPETTAAATGALNRGSKFCWLTPKTGITEPTRRQGEDKLRAFPWGWFRYQRRVIEPNFGIETARMMLARR